MDDPLGPHDLEIARRFTAGRAAVWRCLTEPALIGEWFCPRPWRATDIIIELVPGGRFSTIIRGPEGEVHDEGPGCVLDVAAPSRLVWTSALGPGWRPLPAAPGGLAFTAVMTLRDAGDGGTLYAARALHATAEARQRHAAMGFAEGWGAAADQLGALALTL